MTPERQNKVERAAALLQAARDHVANGDIALARSALDLAIKIIKALEDDADAESV